METLAHAQRGTKGEAKAWRRRRRRWEMWESRSRLAPNTRWFTATFRKCRALGPERAVGGLSLVGGGQEEAITFDQDKN